MPSQLGQDELVDQILKSKTNGFFLDIGACYPEYMSNTHFFEMERGWTGVGVDIEEKYQSLWKERRPKSFFHLEDATKVDYQKLLDSVNAPKVVDYLSIDVDPPTTLSLESLYKVFETDYSFNVITFECDYGGDVECNFQRKGTRDESRKFLMDRGYILVKEIYDRVKTHYHVDDLWIHERIKNET